MWRGLSVTSNQAPKIERTASQPPAEPEKVNKRKLKLVLMFLETGYDARRNSSSICHDERRNRKTVDST